jgi:AcrR family transcriptional regulator
VGRGEDTRQAVLAEAIEIAARLGLAGLTIGSLATATGMSKSGLFAHFRSKEALQLATLAHAREAFIDAVMRPTLTAPRGEARVRALFEHWLRSAREDWPAGCLFVSAATEFDDRPGRVRDQLVRDQLDLLDAIAQIFATGVSEGEFRAGADPMDFAQDLNGVMLAYFHAHRLLQDPAAEHRARRAFARLLADACDPASSPVPDKPASTSPSSLTPAGAPATG